MNLEEQIKEGLLNIIEDGEIKTKIDEIFKFLPNLDKTYYLKDSKIFISLFNEKKGKNPTKEENEIFIETEKDFEKLKLLFNNNWINLLDLSTLKALKFLKNEDAIRNELSLLQNYFRLYEKNKLFLNNLFKEILNFIKNDTIQIISDLELNQQNKNLEAQLEEKNKIIQQHNSTILNGKKTIEKLKNDIYMKDNDIAQNKDQLLRITEEMNKLKANNNINDNNSNYQEEKFAIIFIDSDHDVKYPISCSPNDIIADLEQKLYSRYPEYTEINTLLTVNGINIKRFKTIEQNGIKNGDIIIVKEYKEESD